MNARKKPFNDIKVRKAFSHLFNKEEYMKLVTIGSNVIKGNGYIPKGLVGYDPSLIDYEYSLDMANKLLDEAGYKDRSRLGTITMIRTNYLPFHKEFKKLIEEFYRRVKINIVVKHIPHTKLIELMNAYEYQMLNAEASTEFPEAYYLLADFHSKSNCHYSGVIIPELDQLLDEVLFMNLKRERVTNYHKIEKLIKNYALNIHPNYGTFQNDYYKKYVHGLNISPLGSVILKMKDVWLEPSN